MPEPRDVLAERIAQWAGGASVYDYADRLIKDLDAAGFEIGPLRPDTSGTLEHDHVWSRWTYRFCLQCDAVLEGKEPAHSDGSRT